MSLATPLSAGCRGKWVFGSPRAHFSARVSAVISHLRCLNFAKGILSPSQRILFLGKVIDPVQMTATVSAERATTIQRHATSFEERTARPLKAFPENAGPYGSGFAGTSFGSASHATYPVLAGVEGSIRGLASRTPQRNGNSGLCISPGPLERPPLAKARRDLRSMVISVNFLPYSPGVSCLK